MSHSKATNVSILFSKVGSNFLIYVQGTTRQMAKELFLLNDTGKNKSQSWPKA